MVTTTIRMPSMRRLPVLALALVVAALAVTSPLLATAQDDDGVTVVGKVGEAGFADGQHDVSRIKSPTAICTYTPSMADRVGGSNDVVMIAADGYFRMYDRTIGVTTTLRTASGNLFRHTDGVITGCAQHATPTQASILYYVSGDSKVNWIQEGSVRSITVTPDTTKFVSVDVQEDRLFLMTTAMDAVWRCALSSSGPANCRAHKFMDTLKWEHTDRATIAVTSETLFVATGKKMYAFAVPKETDAVIPQFMGGMDTYMYNFEGIDIAVVRKSVDGNIYGLSTTSSIYAFADGYVTPRLLLGADKPSCPNSEEPYETFCDFTDMHVFNDNEMYMALGERHAVRAKLSGRMRVFLNLPRPPVPVGMDDATDTLYRVAHEVQRAAAKAVPSAEGVFISTAALSVDADSWTSAVPVQVYNGGFYDAIWDLVSGSDYSAAMGAVTAYYDRTNAVVSADALLLPMCDGDLMHSVETAIASHAGELLKTPLIYTTPIDAAAVTADGTTPVKLLMSSSFKSKTTGSALARGDFDAVVLDELRRSVPAGNRYTVELSKVGVDLSAFDESQRQRARAMAQRIAAERIEQCGHMHAVVAASSCKAPAVGVSRIFADAAGRASHMELFLSPAAYPNAATIAECLDGASWAGMRSAASVAESEGGVKCSRACVIGVAVACAGAVVVVAVGVVAAFIVRRRRAAEARKAAAQEDGDFDVKSVEPITPSE